MTEVPATIIDCARRAVPAAAKFEVTTMQRRVRKDLWTFAHERSTSNTT